MQFVFMLGKSTTEATTRNEISQWICRSIQMLRLREVYS